MTTKSLLTIQASFTDLQLLITHLKHPYKHYQHLRIIEWFLYWYTAFAVATTQSWLIHVSQATRDKLVLTEPILLVISQSTFSSRL